MVSWSFSVFPKLPVNPSLAISDADKIISDALETKVLSASEIIEMASGFRFPVLE